MKDKIIVNKELNWSLDGNKTKRNNNTLIIGSPGTGKSTLEAYNILSMGEMSHVIVDPKGALSSMIPKLKEKGYQIKEFDLLETKKSDSFNPLANIRPDHIEEDILMVSRAIYGEINNVRDPYWDLTAVSLLTALISYVMEVFKKDKRNLLSVIDMIGACKATDNGLNIGILFNLLERIKGNDSLAVKQFSSVDVTARTTASCIVSSLSSRIHALMCNHSLSILEKNDIDLKEIGKKKTAFFIRIKDYDTSLHPIVNILLTQLIQQLYILADRNKNKKLDVPVMCWFDDFGSYTVPGMDSFMATARSRGIGFTLLFQSMSQLAKNYGLEQSKILFQCADQFLYLGGNDIETVKYISQLTNWSQEYITLLDAFEAIVYQRGKKTVKTKLVDFEAEPDKCIWNYT